MFKFNISATYMLQLSDEGSESQYTRAFLYQGSGSIHGYFGQKGGDWIRKNTNGADVEGAIAA